MKLRYISAFIGFHLATSLHPAGALPFLLMTMVQRRISVLLSLKKLNHGFNELILNSMTLNSFLFKKV